MLAAGIVVIRSWAVRDRSRGRARRGGLLLAAGLMALAPPAGAFCRKTTCSDCPVDPVTGCPTGGVVLAWPGRCVSYSPERSASRTIGVAELSTLLGQAFAVWQSVQCPGSGAPPSIDVTDAFGLTACGVHEYDFDGPNANVVVVHDDGWPYRAREDAAAVTHVTSSVKTGAILDADIELNADVPFFTGLGLGTEGYDLLSVLIHEAGHFLGLAHSSAPGATMQPVYAPGTTDYRTLSDDDVAGICAIYPPERAGAPCDFTPGGGFAAECALGFRSGGCSVGGPVAPSGAGLAGIASLALLAWARRRSRVLSGICRD